MSINSRLTAIAAAACLACTSLAALADDHAYTEGAVVNMAKIRTVDGKFDEYMKWVDSTWKKEQEAAMKAGDVIAYEVMAVEPRTIDDPDLILMITYKNWAALDGALAKGDAISKQVEGSVAAASQSQVGRASIRRVLGSETMQQLKLK